MLDVMLDLETLGTSAGCAVLSIGAVLFGERGVGDGFYRIINRKGCELAGLHEDNDTLIWWSNQSDEARKVLEGGDLLSETLYAFRGWLPNEARVWGNGADFDLPILGAAYKAIGDKVPWKPYNGRCYRTVKNQFKDIKLQRGGTHHNALDDARSQAEHLVAICLNRGWNLA